jgi:hypothetical protein
MSSFSALIFLYAPVALFFGLLFADAVVLAQRWRPGPALVGTLVVAVLLWGGREMARMVRLPEHAIGLRPDVRAAAWIAANLPADGRLFLAEAYWYPTYSSVVGADGGWWLPVLAGRRTTVPVQYPLLNDRPFEPDYTSRIYTLTRALLAAPLGDETVRAALCALDVGYAYVGQHKGPGPGVDGDPLLFTADELTGSGWFEPVYAHDRVKVYQLRPGVCP